VHLDLLTGARRLWRNAFGSCRLIALEQRVARFMRGPDIPGAAIPRAYFDYLRFGPNPVLQSVLTHNVHDIVSLAALTVCACDRVCSEPAALEDPLELLSLARIFEWNGGWNRAAGLYEAALRGGLPAELSQKAEESLALLRRRCGDHAGAMAIWSSLMERPQFSPQAYVGAAAYYERVMRDPSRALEVVEDALCRLEGGAHAIRWRPVFDRRRDRLRQKTISF
jgi:hypothetical protein